MIRSRLIAIAVAMFAAPAAAEPALEDFAFLEGRWRGDNDGLIFEEIWSGPEAGLMTGMARGARDGKPVVLEYILVVEEADGVFMRFKHYNTDFSTWEKDAPIVLRFVETKEDDALFRADDPAAEVQSVRYWKPTETTMKAEVVLIQNGETDGFTLDFSRVSE